MFIYCLYVCIYMCSRRSEVLSFHLHVLSVGGVQVARFDCHVHLLPILLAHILLLQAACLSETCDVTC